VPRVTQVLSSGQTNTNWSQYNDLIGQYITLFSNCPDFHLISDNNPSTGSTGRNITFTVGNCKHYVQFYPYSSYSSCGYYVKNLANNGSVVNNWSYSVSNSLNYNAWLLYSGSIFYGNIGGPPVPLYFKATDGNWYLNYGGFWDNSQDVSTLSLYTTYMDGYDVNGNYFPIRGKIRLGNQFQTFDPIGIYGISNLGLNSGSTYQDAYGKYWYISGTTSYTDLE